MNALTHIKQLHRQEWQRKHPSIDERYYAGKKYTDKTANGLTAFVIDLIRFNGGQAERISSGGRVIDNRRTVTDFVGRQKQIGSVQRVYSTSTNGTADISATIAGRSIKIEVKVGRDRQSEAQRTYQQSVEQAGGVYIIATSAQQFFEWLNDFLNLNN